MNELQEVADRSRYIKLSAKDKLYILDANCWLPGETMYTVNLRASADSIEHAARLVLAKMDFYKAIKEHKEKTS
jgi:hypothetical protein